MLSLPVNYSSVADTVELVDLHLGEQRVGNIYAQLIQHGSKVVDFLQIRASFIVAEVGVENLLSFVRNSAVLDHRAENIVERSVVAQCDDDLPAVLSLSAVVVLRHGFLVGATILPNSGPVHLHLPWGGLLVSPLWG